MPHRFLSRVREFDTNISSNLKASFVKIDGTVVNNGDKFTLFVEPNGRVTGRVAGQSVRFSVRKTVRDSAAAKLKKEQDLAVADLSAR
jgi:hypothetical protein